METIFFTLAIIAAAGLIAYYLFCQKKDSRSGAPKTTPQVSEEE